MPNNTGYEFRIFCGSISISGSKSFPRIRFYGCPGVRKLYFCTAASPGYPMQKYNFCTPPETFRSAEYYCQWILQTIAVHMISFK